MGDDSKKMEMDEMAEEGDELEGNWSGRGWD
jgi:hypothetical protein